ncbi:MAG: hypothetical protein H5U08_06140 [Thermogutta sp.]|uniref:hypothetical protein n=1 Tax=Thermogutta sp. TaxID=1962930 RepID=UPI0019A90FE6|nr:hypothetical protein [Thermogutta sp.]MBC7351921.1 hypothetical protein [Thermogutta sp.]
MTANVTPTVAVLFAQARTHYRSLPGVEVWDRRRDARGYPGPYPVVAHPPCRVYSRYLSKQAKAPPDEYTLAIFAVAAVRAYGGVLEHPRISKLWDRCGLPPPGESDAWGFTIEIWQWWFGYPGGKKRTWLYCCGVHPDDLPPIPYRLWTPGDHERWQLLSRAARSKTPPALCEWLVSVARLCGRVISPRNDRVHFESPEDAQYESKTM